MDRCISCKKEFDNSPKIKDCNCDGLCQCEGFGFITVIPELCSECETEINKDIALDLGALYEEHISR